ncbi:Ectin [Holothuria leucospilota]|uniref:Ectin n=1 Tax=Holothuria leucospilota TaxID=206669 RepID=A0A9Q1C8B5_HOLLE|nr:Ectin [Holothuria leucospilota]
MRLCNSPPALYGGLHCTGSNNMSSECYVTRCEGDGGWSEWSQWTDCSHSCEGGLEWRKRTCNNPPPNPPYGEDCRGFSNESRPCNSHICPGWCMTTVYTLPFFFELYELSIHREIRDKI